MVAIVNCINCSSSNCINCVISCIYNCITCTNCKCLYISMLNKRRKPFLFQKKYIPLPTINIKIDIFMKTKVQQKSATCGTKSEKHVRLGQVCHQVLKPKNFHRYYYSSTESSEETWRNFQKHIRHHYPVAQEAQRLIKELEADLGPQGVAYWVDCFRGFTHKMQLSMFSSIHDYLCYGDLVTTGIVHVDELIKKMLHKL